MPYGARGDFCGVLMGAPRRARKSKTPSEEGRLKVTP
jgi:hypothetical protein